MSNLDDNLFSHGTKTGNPIPAAFDDARPKAEDSTLKSAEHTDPKSAGTSDDDYDPDAYEYVRLPNGRIVAVPKGDVQTAEERPKTAKSEAASAAVEDERENEFYVHLADGSVERVAESDLPTSAGTNASYGHWVRDSKTYLIIGVYPVEDEPQKR